MKRRLLSRYRDLVRQRYEIVFKLAVESLRRGDKEYARKLCTYIKEMAERTRVRIGPLKRLICKNCHIPLIPGVTATIRLKAQSRRFAYRVVRCKECGYIHRYPYKIGHKKHTKTNP